MTDETGPRSPDDGADQPWSHPQSSEEGRSEAARPPADTPPGDQRSEPPEPQQPADAWTGEQQAERPAPQQPAEARNGGPAAPPQPEAGAAPDSAYAQQWQPPQGPPQAGAWAAPPPPPPGGPVAGTGQWPIQGAGGQAPGVPHYAQQGGPGMGGPVAPPGGPGGPGAPGAGHFPAAGFPPPRPQRQRRGMPLWAVLIVVAVVAVGSAGVGGALGGSLGVQSAAPSGGESSPKLNTDLPSDAPSRAPDTVAGVAQRVSPSVVSIQDGGTSLSGNGSGFVIENDHVVTNNHVASALQGADMEVVYSDGQTSGASVVGTRPESDLAVLELEDPMDVQPLEFGDSAKVTVGDEVIAIGAPLGLAGTVTSGIISAVDRPVNLGEDSSSGGAAISALQTDAAINPGNSGGPLVDAQGRVIGVNTAIATLGGGGAQGGQSGSIGLGFAIPSAEAEGVVDDIVSGAGEGGSGSQGDAEMGVLLDEGYDQGARIAVPDEQSDVSAVEPGGPADEAGLRAGDVVIQFDGRDISDADTLVRLIGEYEAGDRVEVVYERNGERRTTDITLGSTTD
ncbi:S1C family serine protease [Streptomonospora wellingtoniae]|uniref:Trypsin-like peptidase domain-containing protein n=1 Tax=Streptomonospora wellingtoniae TaxID=3075544 RepID=A0ABU2KSQ5_9ACTN|nr:trypsin-like peptidase domain-containing protein [Streptomonospora sp. DSM 45055]MDT0302307.1 trypsin-like peptidase domain-containing protein [Streptomonospora sp. DSM 45055]